MPSSSNDFWRVNSYGYPNPFSREPNATQAWETFLSFLEFSSYDELKKYWGSAAAPRLLAAHAVESWKATFEEFGLLYVISRSDEITITPAGAQFRDAGEGGRRQEFAWIGLSLLLRYPLQGPPRRSRGLLDDSSDLLLYWFIFAAMRELQNYLWWSELERVLCKVFRVDQAAGAIAHVEPQATWLLIDELNRAHIDKAFGELFTVLGTDELVAITLPHQNEGNRELVTPRRFRVVATLNSVDRQFVNSLGQGLKRRFTFITLDIPGPRRTGEEWGDADPDASLASREFTMVSSRTADRVARRIAFNDNGRQDAKRLDDHRHPRRGDLQDAGVFGKLSRQLRHSAISRCASFFRPSRC